MSHQAHTFPVALPSVTRQPALITLISLRDLTGQSPHNKMACIASPVRVICGVPRRPMTVKDYGITPPESLIVLHGQRYDAMLLIRCRCRSSHGFRASSGRPDLHVMSSCAKPSLHFNGRASTASAAIADIIANDLLAASFAYRLRQLVRRASGWQMNQAPFHLPSLSMAPARVK